jgi:hypothetical protein
MTDPRGRKMGSQSNGAPGTGVRRGAFVQHVARFDSDTFEEIREKAVRDGTSLSEAIRTLCVWGLEAEQEDRADG